MKTCKYITIVFFGFLCITASAQDDSNNNSNNNSEKKSSRDAKHSLVFGLKAGANRSNVYDEEGKDFVAGAKTGFAGGAFLSIPIGGFLGVQPEVLISQKGFKSSGTIDSSSYNLQRTSTFLDIPLQIQLKPFRFLSILGGIQYSYLLNQQDQISFGPNSIEQNKEFKNDNIRRNIFGAVGGFDINISHLVLSGRAGWDLSANRGDGSSYTPRYKNFWVQGTVGIRIY